MQIKREVTKVDGKCHTGRVTDVTGPGTVCPEPSSVHVLSIRSISRKPARAVVGELAKLEALVN
jgi:hypothetical protein